MKLYIPIGKILCLLLFILSSGTRIYSQCGDGSHLSTLSYDTIFRGTGNSSYNVDFPQFDTNVVYFRVPQFIPSKGTLVEVDIQTIISVKYTYKLENQDSVVMLSKIRLNRSDTIFSDALKPNLFLESFLTKIVVPNIVLSPSDGSANIGSGPDYQQGALSYGYKNQHIDNVITENLAGFLGNGDVLFKYITATDLFPSGGKYSWDPTTEDSVYFKLTYKYCLTSLLPADIGNFTATKLSSGSLQLSWSAPNDMAGNRYEMQKSADGNNYNSFETIISKSNAANSYQVNYTPVSNDKNKIFFRIKQFEADGSIKYSLVRAVDLEYTSSTMKVYPTLTRNDVNIYFPYAAKGDYQVSIVSITGQVMQQSSFSRTSFIKLALNASLKPGMYMVSVVNKKTSETQLSKIVIQ